ncbi:Rho-GTPase-activating protein 5 [Cytospora mali]|uniref:Rho-GTPase-activating protein 5 n=1 Tax=Cytospora mali TaxID=578113 RepID=A0A194VDD3_CYTMA|nr:Rho-GTPase-activating protein 5 [Valsa mali var. pyri (nom. inval.)]
MTSAANHPQPPHIHPPTTANHATTAQPPTPTSHTSPPSKRDLKSWWKNFKLSSRHEESHGEDPSIPCDNFPKEPKLQGIFGVPLRQSIVYANVAISLVDDYGKSYIYGYVPIVVAKCGVFLKEKATSVEGIFRLNGSEKRIKELKQIFDSPDRYGKGLSWDGYTVHDAANVLRRYLNDLPEPVVPLDLYEKFRDPLRGATRSAVGDAEGPHFIDDFDVDGAIVKYQQLIKELPPLNRQLLLYILDLLAVFAAKADENRMNSQNLAAIFQPGMLSHPIHAMAPEEYRLNQCVIIFLIENQDHFLIGMQGTAADEKTVQAVQKGTPVINAPATPSSSRKPGVHRSASNASAGAESVSREGKIRRNKSTSSRHSRASNGAPSPGSPAVSTPTSGGLGRSNTVPSKRSPAMQHGRFAHMRNETLAAAPVSPLTPVVASPANIPAPPTVEEVATPEAREYPNPMVRSTGGLTPAHAAQRSQERLLESKPAPEAMTPVKDRNLSSLFQRSPTDGSEKKPPNKLRKKRIPSTNPSAASSTASLPHSIAASPNTESQNPMERIGESPRKEAEEASQALKPESVDTPSEPTPRASQMPSTGTLHTQNADHILKAQKSPPDSLNSSFNGSEVDRVDESLPSTENPESAEQQDREKKRRWRLSRKKEDADALEPGVTSPRRIGFNRTADMSTSSVGTEGYKPRRSFTGDSSEPTLDLHSSFDSGRDGRDEHKGLSGWIKNKMREAKESADHKRTKSPPGDHAPIGNILPMRGKSLDLKRPNEAEKDVPKAQEPSSSQH